MHHKISSSPSPTTATSLFERNRTSTLPRRVPCAHSVLFRDIPPHLDLHIRLMPKPKTPNKSGKPAAESSNLHIAEAAFNRVKPSLDAMPLTGLDTPRLDLQAAAVQAIGVAQTLSAPLLRQRITAIAATGALDAALIDGLESVAWATWFARHKFLLTSATHSGAALPAALVERASETRARMLKTLEYHLDDDPEAAAQLAHLRAGAGHLDLANDLSGAAAMYRKHHESIKHDKRNYRVEDEQDASALAEQILRLLGATTTPEQTLWKGYQARAANQLFRHYDEAVRVGRFLFYYDDPEGRFPNLYTATRSAPTSPRPDKKPEVDKTPETTAPTPSPAAPPPVISIG
ncbi:hypothetical protein [Sorangium sp. So ce131]|uniref:hypothetical protein n=1 Tax=Sorangium sp. So ce131 TaxID=3133282 RepID=UPI003F5E23A9